MINFIHILYKLNINFFSFQNIKIKWGFVIFSLIFLNICQGKFIFDWKFDKMLLNNLRISHYKLINKIRISHSIIKVSSVYLVNMRLNVYNLIAIVNIFYFPSYYSCFYYFFFIFSFSFFFKCFYFKLYLKHVKYPYILYIFNQFFALLTLNAVT